MARTKMIVTRPIPIQPSFLFHSITAPIAGASKCLSQGDVELRSFHSLHRVQVSSDVKANRAYGSLVPESDAHSIGVISNEMANTYRAINITAIVENRCTQPFFDAQR